MKIKDEVLEELSDMDGIVKAIDLTLQKVGETIKKHHEKCYGISCMIGKEEDCFSSIEKELGLK